MDSILLKFRDKFIEESHSLLDKLEKDLLQLEKDQNNQELIESVFRGMHTIKGVSSMYGFEYISDFTHHLESIYQSIREGKKNFVKDIADISFTSIDHIRKLLSDEHLSDNVLKESHAFLLENVKNISLSENEKTLETEVKKNVSVKKTEMWHIILRTNDEMIFRGISLLNIFRELAGLGEYQISQFSCSDDTKSDVWNIFFRSGASEDEIREVFLFVEDDCTFTRLTNYDDEKLADIQKKSKNVESIVAYVERVYKTAKDDGLKKKESQSFTVNKDEKLLGRISVDSEKLDQLMFLVSELITVNSQLLISTKAQLYDPIRNHIEKVDNLSKQFRNNALDIRLVPLGDTVVKFQRLIRDLSKSLNKKIDFQTQGMDTELDKNTIDRITDPLMHIIRNSIDHGIETPEKRILKGKTETGILKLSAFPSGSHIIIRIDDDGSGIDFEKVRLKAIDKNIISQTDKPTKQEIFELIFLPGFSTAQSLTSVSGRGVGMDVVKKSITDLRGEVIVESEEGAGTSFILKLPQSLSIIDSLLLTVGSTFFIVPLSDIEICEQIEADKIDKMRNTATIPYNDLLISFIDMRSVFKISGEYGKKVKMIIIRNNNKYVALLADKIVGEHQAVLKPLGIAFRKQKFITSASQMGDGNLAFMLDTNAIIKNYSSLAKSKIST